MKWVISFACVWGATRGRGLSNAAAISLHSLWLPV